MTAKTYYKIARPDGWDFYTGETINYRDAIGKTVRPPATGAPVLCSPTVLHASEIADKCFIGGKVPCSLYVVEGTPVVSDSQKHGFSELKVIEEMDPASHFKWRYAEAVNPVHPLSLHAPAITDEILSLLEQWVSVKHSVWTSVRDSAWDSFWTSVRTSVRASVWASVGDSFWDSFWASVWDSVWDSVRNSVVAYIGWIFAPVVTTWQHIDHAPGEYPFQPAVDLWHRGLVSSYDGKTWRLHAGPDAKVLWQGTRDDLRKEVKR